MLGIRPKLTAELKPAGMGLRFTGGIDTFFAFAEIDTSSDPVKESNPTVQTMSEFTLGPWVLVNFEPLPILSVNAGLRYDTAFVKTHMDAWSGMDYSNGPPTPVSYAAGDESTDWNAFVYEAGLTVNPFDFLKVYAKYGTQFRYPYLNDLIVMPFLPGDTIALNTDLKPEKGWTVEGGIGVNIKGIAKFDANMYYLRIDNEILSILTPMQSMATLNLDPINRIGTDIGLTLTPIKYAELNVDYGFVNAEFSEGDFEGKTVPLVAAHTLSASLMLHAPFGLSLGPNVLYKSEMYQGLDNANAQETVDPSLVWGLQARYAIHRFKGELAIMLTVHNLADTKYASMVMNMPAFPSYGIQGGPTYFVDNNMGRSINLSVQYRF
jgi:iron complex outermembrane receptor protein